MKRAHGIKLFFDIMKFQTFRKIKIFPRCGKILIQCYISFERKHKELLESIKNKNTFFL